MYHKFTHLRSTEGGNHDGQESEEVEYSLIEPPAKLCDGVSRVGATVAAVVFTKRQDLAVACSSLG